MMNISLTIDPWIAAFILTKRRATALKRGSRNITLF